MVDKWTFARYLRILGTRYAKQYIEVCNMPEFKKEFKSSYERLIHNASFHYGTYDDILRKDLRSIKAAVTELKNKATENFVLIPGPFIKSHSVPTILLVSKVKHPNDPTQTAKNSSFYIYQYHVNKDGRITNFMGMPDRIDFFAMRLRNTLVDNNPEIHSRNRKTSQPAKQDRQSTKAIHKKSSSWLSKLFKGLMKLLFTRKHKAVTTPPRLQVSTPEVVKAPLPSFTGADLNKNSSMLPRLIQLIEKPKKPKPVHHFHTTTNNNTLWNTKDESHSADSLHQQTRQISPVNSARQLRA